MYNLQHSQFHMLSLFTCRQKYGKNEFKRRVLLQYGTQK